MTDRLHGKRIALLATDGVEQVELTAPRDAVLAEGAVVQLVSVADGEIQGMNGDIEPADTFTVDRVAAQVSVDDYDGLIVPGGTVNGDKLRLDDDVRYFVQAFVESGKPVAAICHAPWVLIDAGVVKGRTVTSFPSVWTDLRNAGATVVDEEVSVDGNLITSRSPGDLPAFTAAVVDALAG
ncbi:type 1 glutamine amidotransferase domain-containing protein [Pseudonocardia abyssalis]|uniref:Type 1 glutamine amidotransferase n=1 Tax=Pseudonocardia abyssalis TaxID=2792008 RepID=A0ABS6UP70_9PSEU|nr:type 1 glutamine amidotransferase domain-containing protein [Pseudonocardia abyssalis]MBW0117590.1 type 1 glutamine amidotransferase [Pseudonocardia abyssalis]MBW0134045.1 type 1 glutamine amidotransferase [Pseudonocardia abyssalis]